MNLIVNSKKLLFSSFLFLYLPLVFSQNIPPSSWTNYLGEESTTIDYRHYPNSKLIEVKSRFIVKSTLSGFLLFLQDTDNIPNWLDNAYQSEIIKHISTNENIFITHFNGIWPVKPRNMVIQTRYYQDKELTIHINVSDASGHAKIIDNSIRVTMIKAHWQVKPIAKNTLDITYQFIVDPNGAVPKWLVNKLTLSSIKQTLINIKQQLPISPWQEFKINGISEYDDHTKY